MDPDPRDDVHALGVIGYQMLTGQLSQGAGPDFADELRESGAPDDFVTLLGRCVAQRVERRPKDARELLSQLAPATPASLPVPSLPAAVRVQNEPTPAPISPGEIKEQKPQNTSDTAVAQTTSVEGDPESVTQYMEAAAKGDATAQYQLAMCYAEGRGVSQDDSAAVGWLRKAAKQEQADAQFQLGKMYESGTGVRKNRPSAIRWYQRAAEQGHADAQCQVGDAYWHGQGVAHSETIAAEWYRKGAEQGHPFGQFMMGLMSEDGQGMPKDHRVALEWYRKAAEQGFDPAQANLGTMYLDGHGVPRDVETALKWFRKAAKNNGSNVYDATIEEIEQMLVAVKSN